MNVYYQRTLIYYFLSNVVIIIFDRFKFKFYYINFRYYLLLNINYYLINNEIHLYEMLIINLLTYFNKVEKFHDTMSRKIVF